MPRQCRVAALMVCCSLTHMVTQFAVPALRFSRYNSNIQTSCRR